MPTFQSVFARPLTRLFAGLSLATLALISVVGAPAASAQSVPVPGSPLPAGFVAPRTGTYRVLVLGCYFSDTQLANALVEATTGIQKMYGPANQTPTITQYFERVSNGMLHLQADVKGWYELPGDFKYYANDIQNNNNPGVDAQETDCKQIAQAQLNADAYDTVVMLFNADTNMSNHTSKDSRYIRLRPWGGHGGWSNQATHVHELGHALGLWHSPISGEDEYSNGFDAMSGFDMTSQSFFFWNASGWCNGYLDGVDMNGTDFGILNSTVYLLWAGKARCIYENTGGAKHVAVRFSAHQKVRLGWLSDGPKNTAMFNGGGTTFSLQAVGSRNLPQKQMIAIPIGTDQFYSVEYRKRDADYYEGGLAEDAVVMYRVDASGASARVAVLHPGESFVDSAGTVNIEYRSTVAPDVAAVWVSGPVPTPTLTSISPNYARTGGDVRLGSQPVTIKGSSFVPWSTALWNGVTALYAQRSYGGSFVDPSTLAVSVQNDVLKAGQSGFVTVQNLNGGGNDKAQYSDPLPYFVSPSGAATGASASKSTSTSGTLGVDADKVNVTATGIGSLAAATLVSNPGANRDFPSADRWFALLASPHATFGTIDAKTCDLNGGDGLRYWTGAAWAPVDPAPTFANTCLTFTATGTSKPSVFDLQGGALFGISRAFAFGAIDAPAQVNEGAEFAVRGSIRMPSTDTMGVSIDWGDGTNPDTIALAPGQASFSQIHRYAGNPKGMPVGKYRLSMKLTDSHGALASADTRAIYVANVAPKVQLSTNVQTEAPGNPVTLYGLIADPGQNTETYTETVDWGDGTVETRSDWISFAAQHVYADRTPAGNVTFTISVTAKDSDGATGSASVPVTITMGVAASQVWMCDDANYGGRCRIYREKELAVLDSVGAFKDTVSSIKIIGPGMVSVYANNYYQGKCETFTASDPWLGDNWIGNDSISSMKLGVPCP